MFKKLFFLLLVPSSMCAMHVSGDDGAWLSPPPIVKCRDAANFLSSDSWERKEKAGSFADLPAELIIYLARFLDIVGTVQLSRTCKYLNRLQPIYKRVIFYFPHTVGLMKSAATLFLPNRIVFGLTSSSLPGLRSEEFLHDILRHGLGENVVHMAEGHKKGMDFHFPWDLCREFTNLRSLRIEGAYDMVETGYPVEKKLPGEGYFLCLPAKLHRHVTSDRIRALCKCPSLTRLDLSDNHLHKLPPEIQNLKGTLRKLILTDNNISVRMLNQLLEWLPNTVITYSERRDGCHIIRSVISHQASS